jgi:hypothetical protein
MAKIVLIPSYTKVALRMDLAVCLPMAFDLQYKVTCLQSRGTIVLSDNAEACSLCRVYQWPSVEADISFQN